MILAYIRWFDSAIIAPDCIEVVDLPTPCEMESAGLLLDETEKHVTIALDRCCDTGLLRCALTIPRVNIRSIKKFSTVRKNADTN